MTCLFQQLYSVPKALIKSIGCWPWRKDVQEIDRKSISSSSPSTYSTEKRAPPDLLDEKKIPLPYYLTWPDEHFAISEYNWKDDHFVDLTKYPTQDRLVAKALREFRNRRTDYADPEIPYERSFTLEDVLESLRQLATDEPDFQWTKREYYIVAYYSTLRPDLTAEDRKILAELDEAAFREALPSKAFIRYWFGRPDQYGRNLATCLWTNRNDARRTLANGPFHRRAARQGEGLYAKGTIDIREYTMTIDDDVSDWRVDLLSQRIHA